MSEPWPDSGNTYDVAAEHHAGTFAGIRRQAVRP